MPQMMPINWMLSFFSFIIIFIIFNILNYYIFNFKKKNHNFFKIIKYNNILWKW